MNVDVPKIFKTIKNNKLEFAEGKIYNYSEEGVFTYIVVFVVLLLNFVVINYFTANTHGINPKNNPITMLIALSLGFQFGILDMLVKLYNVIDFTEALIYKELFFFGAKFRFKVHSREEILQIGNSVVGLMTNPGGKRGTVNGRVVNLNPDTNLFDSYEVQILLASGEVFRLEFGYFKEDYYETKEFVSYLSEFWNIPKVSCEDGYQLLVKSVGNGVYVFDDKKIEYHSWTGKLLLVFGYFLLIVLIGYGICWGYDNFFGKQSKDFKPTYRYEHRYGR